jgi:hypothetical protein
LAHFWANAGMTIGSRKMNNNFFMADRFMVKKEISPYKVAPAST